MKRIISLCIIIAAMLPIMAQSSQVKKAAKNIFKLTTFNAEGKLLSTSYGILIDADGTALSSWNPFVGASSANILDAQGRKYDVDCLIGANEIYNVSKFRVVVPNEKKMQIAPVNITSETVPVGGECWMVEYGMKNPAIKRFSPSIVETFADNLPYYTFEQTASDDLAGSPFLNASGELMGLMQPATKRTDLYCPSAQYAMSMTVNALTANQATIRQTNIRVALPDTYDQAADTGHPYRQSGSARRDRSAAPRGLRLQSSCGGADLSGGDQHRKPTHRGRPSHHRGALAAGLYRRPLRQGSASFLPRLSPGRG